MKVRAASAPMMQPVTASEGECASSTTRDSPTATPAARPSATPAMRTGVRVWTSIRNSATG